jgi:hypothetical protein
MPPANFDPIKAKQKKQKRIVIAGAVLLVIVLAVEGPSTLKKLKGGGGTPAWLAASRAGTAVGTPVSVSPSATAPPSAVPGAAPTSTDATGAVTAGSSVLVSDSGPTAGPGQLPSFGTFASKDPFAAQVNVGNGTATPADSVDGYPGAKGASTTPAAVTPSLLPPPVTPSANGGAGSPSAPASITSVVIAVNGILGSVDVGTDFPAVSPTFPVPLFHLVSATQKTAKISIAGGSYQSGAATMTLVVGKKVTLENTADGTRYTLKLYPQGTQVPTTTQTESSATPTTPSKSQKPQAPTGPTVTTPLIPTTALTP